MADYGLGASRQPTGHYSTRKNEIKIVEESLSQQDNLLPRKINFNIYRARAARQLSVKHVQTLFYSTFFACIRMQNNFRIIVCSCIVGNQSCSRTQFSQKRTVARKSLILFFFFFFVLTFSPAVASYPLVRVVWPHPIYISTP